MGAFTRTHGETVSRGSIVTGDCGLTNLSVIFTLHFQMMLKKLKFCLHTANLEQKNNSLSLLGIHELHFFSKVTKEKILQMAYYSGVPLGVDETQSQGDISLLLIDLFNGAKNGTITLLYT